MNFSRVVFDNTIKGDIARVNRADGTLYINPDIWQRLTGLEREFILFHEDGHLQLQTASEFTANKYAVEKFCPVQTLTDSELGKRIVVMTEITDPDQYISGSGGGVAVDPVSAVANAVGSVFDGIGTVFESLPLLGIGKKSRMQETEAQKKAALEISESKTAGTVKIVAIAGVIVIVVVTLIFLLK